MHPTNTCDAGVAKMLHATSPGWLSTDCHSDKYIVAGVCQLWHLGSYSCDIDNCDVSHRTLNLANTN